MRVSWKAAVRALLAGAIIVVLLAGTGAPDRRVPSSGPLRAPGAAAGEPAQPLPPAAITGPVVGDPVVPRLTVAVRDLPAAERHEGTRPASDRREFKLAQGLVVGAWQNELAPLDPLLRIQGLQTGDTPSPLFTVEGLNNFAGVSPPDTIGDVGPNHYAQMVNSTAFNVYDKAGTLLAGYPKDLGALWTSGGCATSDAGDPIVVYDSLANRWLLAQFRRNFANGICVAVSQTGDVTGAYWVYEFVTPDFPDYFKISVWPDAYYMSSNETAYSAYALERATMLAGGTARFVRFTGESNFVMPADVDGSTPPPAGSPGYFYTFKDSAYHGGGADRLEISEFHVDWTTPANSTFAVVDTLPVSSFTYTVCGFFTLSCIPQPGTSQKVDAVSEWPMWRLAYRNFGAYQAMVANFAIDTGSDHSGIRWYELRKTGTAAWTVFQEGTHSPDAAHRFMGSIAMDRGGNIALGYSVSSSTVYPSLRYATRLAGDPAGTLQAEAEMYTGAGSQTGSNRWGDYSALSVDPADDCTFWYTNEYYSSNGSNSWRTRIGTFVLPSCGPSVEYKIVLPAVFLNRTQP